MAAIDPKILAEVILQEQGQAAVIGIDGWTGVGKTTLAEALADATGGRAYDLDTALDRNRNCYLRALRLDEIRHALRPHGLLFVSGICLRQVFAEINVEADAHIYVKRMASWGWADEDDLLGRIPEFSESSGEAVRDEMRSYHKKWEPHLRMTYEFHRCD